jgi:hypothetical protein
MRKSVKGVRDTFSFDAAGHSPDPASDHRTVERRFARKRGSGETRRKGSAVPFIGTEKHPPRREKSAGESAQPIDRGGG